MITLDLCSRAPKKNIQTLCRHQWMNCILRSHFHPHNFPFRFHVSILHIFSTLPCLSIFFLSHLFVWLYRLRVWNALFFAIGLLFCLSRLSLSAESRLHALALRPCSNTHILSHFIIISFLDLGFACHANDRISTTMIIIAEGVSRFLFYIQRRLRKTHMCIQFCRVYQKKISILTSMYTSLLGLKVLLTICSETLMCGIECRSLMIIDFSICMLFLFCWLHLTDFPLSPVFSPTQLREWREKENAFFCCWRLNNPNFRTLWDTFA